MKKEYFKPTIEVVDYDVEKNVTVLGLSSVLPTDDSDGESYDDIVWQ